MAYVDESVFIPFRDATLERLYQKVNLFTVTLSGYDGDPNGGGAPPILTGAPIGTYYQQETPALLWRKGQDGNWHPATDEPIMDFAGGTLVLSNLYWHKVIRCLDVTTVQLGAACDINFTCDFIQVTATSIITFEGIDGVTLGVIDDYTSSPITTRSINAEAYIRKDTATHAIVSGALS